MRVALRKVDAARFATVTRCAAVQDLQHTTKQIEQRLHTEIKQLTIKFNEHKKEHKLHKHQLKLQVKTYCLFVV